MTHDNYSFYNPKQHPYFAKDRGRIIYFEGTYTAWLSSNTYPDAALRLQPDDVQARPGRSAAGSAGAGLPVVAGCDQAAIRPMAGRRGRQQRAWIAFFAPDRPFPGSVAVYQEKAAGGSFKLVVKQASSPATAEPPLFYALPGDMKDPPAGTVPLYEFARRNGRTGCIRRPRKPPPRVTSARTSHSASSGQAPTSPRLRFRPRSDRTSAAAMRSGRRVHRHGTRGKVVRRRQYRHRSPSDSSGSSSRSTILLKRGP